MKLKAIIKLFLIAMIAIQFASCDNKEYSSNFNQTPTERLDARKKELSDILISSEFGWKAVYFTDTTQLGGFTHLFKFKDLKNVSMASDFDSDTSSKMGEYDIQLGSTISLVFTTKNRIHLLSDSNSYPNENLRGKGYKGDFQFLYYGQENGDIIFRTNRSFEELRFVKATAQDWDDLSKNTTMNSNLNELPRTLFKSLEINDGANINVFDIDIDVLARYATITSLDETTNDNVAIAIAYTSTGITVKPAIKVNNQKLTHFIFDAVSGNFIATGTDNVSATIKINEPTDTYKELLRGNPTTQFGYFTSYLYGSPSNSTLFESIINDIYIELGDRLKGKSVNVFFIFNDSRTNYLVYSFEDNDENNPESPAIDDIYHNFTTSENSVKKTIVLNPGSWQQNGRRITAPAYLKNLDDQIMNPQGLYVKKESFKINAPNDIYTFTGTTTPAFRITSYSLE